MLLRTIFEKEALALNDCADADTSKFKKPLDSRIFAIKVISEKYRKVLGHSQYAIILADEEGDRNGKYVPIDCGPDYLEVFINQSLLPDFDRAESNTSNEVP